MKILVTGGAGFMGSNFIRYILKKYPNYSVVNLDKLTYAGNLENLVEVDKNPHYSFIKGDIINEGIVLSAMDGVDVVINYAAETHVDRSISDPKSFAETDVLGTLTLLEVAKKKKIKKYIQISTDEVFGSAEEGEKFNEDAPFEPNSPYAASKAGGDHLCRAFWITYHLPIIVTHSCNFYGPFHYPEKMIPLFITNLIEGKKVPLYGNGENIREWIYTEDHCSAIDLILHQGKEGEVYNISTEEGISNLELTKMLLSILGRGEEFIEYINDRPGHDFRYAMDASKLKSMGWQPKYSLDEGLSQTVQWYKENKSWWERIKSGEFKEYYSKQYDSKRQY